MPGSLAPSFRIAFLSLAGLGAAVGCSRPVEVTSVVDGAAVREKDATDASSVSSLTLGERVTVRMPRFGKPQFYRLEGDAPRYVAAEDVAAFPIEGRQVFVANESAPIRKAVGGSDNLKLLDMGDAVSIHESAKAQAQGFAAVVESGIVIGFIANGDITATQPTAAQFADKSRAALRRADFPLAIKLSQLGLKIAAADEPLKSLADVANRAVNDPLSFAPPAAKVAVAPQTPAKKGAKAFVAVLAAQVLADKKADAKVLTVLRQNTPVQVNEVAGDYAQVTLLESEKPVWLAMFGGTLALKLPEQYRAPEDSGQTEVTPAEAAAATNETMYVKLADLAGAPNDPDELFERATKLTSDKKTDEAIELMTRALAAGDIKTEHAQALFDAAIARNDLERAVWAMVMSSSSVSPLLALSGASGWSDATIVEAALLHGCREPLKADATTTVVPALTSLKRPRAGDCLVVTGVEPLCNDCDLPEEQSNRKLEREQRARDKFLETANELYGNGPYLRITVANKGITAGPPREPIFVTMDGDTHWLPIQALGAYEHVAILINVPYYEALYGVSLGEEHNSQPPGTPDYTVNSPDASSTVWLGVDSGECQDCSNIWNPPDEHNDYGDYGDND